MSHFNPIRVPLKDDRESRRSAYGYDDLDVLDMGPDPTNGDEKSSNRRSRSFEYLDVRETGADSEPAFIEMRSKRPLLRTKSTKRSGRRSNAPSRRIDSLDLLSPTMEWGSQQSLHSLASEEELDKERQERESLLGKEPPQLIHIEDGAAVTPIDEDAKSSTPSSQEYEPHDSASIPEYDATLNESVAGQTIVSAVEATPEQAPIPIEVVASEMVPTCKCQSKEACTHSIVWKGVLSEDGTIEFTVQSKDGSVRIVRFPRENSVVMCDTDVEKVCKMIVRTVLTNP